MASLTDLLIRYWDDTAFNKTVSVYYDKGDGTSAFPRRVFKEDTVIDPALKTSGGSSGPLDGLAAGTELQRLAEGLDTVVLTASDTAPYATITVLAGTSTTSCNLLVRHEFAPVAGQPTQVTATLSGSTSAGDGWVTVKVGTGLASAFQALPVTLALAALTAYTVLVTDRNGCAQTLNFTTPRFGCTDPGADNYDPLATALDLSCTYSPRLALAAALPLLVANGRPVPVTLNSAAIPGAVAAPARAFIDVEFLNATAGVELVVNGYRLLSGAILAPTNFIDAPTLAEALRSLPALHAAYLIALSQDTVVQLTARTPGTGGNLTLSTSHPAKVGVSALAGVNQYRSQGRQAWGCFVEVWTGAPGTNPSTFSDTYTDAYRDFYGLLQEGTATVPVLAQRLELAYRDDNQYAFDLAPALRRFTGHAYPNADGTCPDRLTSYFLKFGEVYSQGGTVRRQQSIYQTGVAWALDAVEIPAPFGPSCYLLTSRPAPWRSYRGGAAPTLLLGNLPGATSYASELQAAAFDGASTTAAGPAVAEGRVTRLAPGAFFTGAHLSGAVRVAVPNVGTVPVASLALLEQPGPALTFANGQGGFDTLVFEGEREEISRRTVADYATGTGTATRSATTPDAFRLHSGPLTRAEWVWLRRELGNTPACWLETAAGPVPVSLKNVAFEADEVKKEYTLAVECEPQEQPALGLVN